MVKVFRSFRRIWIEKGSAKKYFLYAIGEILLVVIGILIAFAIDNWNTEKVQRIEEKQIYGNILKKIIEDKSDIEGNAHYNDMLIAQFQYANEIIEAQDRAQIDTLKVILFKLFEYSDFSGSANIYQNLVNSGELKLLKNEAIIEELQELEEHYIYTNRLEVNHWQVILRFMGPGLIDNIHISDLQVERPDELYSFYMQNLLLSAIDIMFEKDDIYQNAISQIDTIGLLIETELKEE
ncbi:MAG: hypothetical protein ACR2MM_07175 [Flavobacteriaceae bacterium]